MNYSRQIKVLIISTLLLAYGYSNGQIGNLNTFDFLELTQSARATALGDFSISLADKDITQGYANPALINPLTNHQVSFNHNFHFADISHGFAAVGFNLGDSTVNFMAGVNYISYGEFTRADQFGNKNGNFSSSENALTLGMSKKLDDRIRVGFNLKYIGANFDGFSASGLGADIGVHLHHPEKRSNWSIVFKNIGYQLNSFNETKEPFPFNIQVGYAKRLAHLPFQFMITAHQLHRWDLRNPLDDQSSTIFIDQDPSEVSGFSKTADNLFRHLAFGGELLLGKSESFKIRFGYNHFRKKELAVSGFRSLSGLSFGFGFRISKFNFDYGVGRYHLGGSVNHLSVGLDLNSFFNKL